MVSEYESDEYRSTAVEGSRGRTSASIRKQQTRKQTRKLTPSRGGLPQQITQRQPASSLQIHHTSTHRPTRDERLDPRRVGAASASSSLLGRRVCG